MATLRLYAQLRRAGLGTGAPDVAGGPDPDPAGGGQQADTGAGLDHARRLIEAGQERARQEKRERAREQARERPWAREDFDRER